jgi:hypothetical protein
MMVKEEMDMDTAVILKYSGVTTAPADPASGGRHLKGAANGRPQLNSYAL